MVFKISVGFFFSIPVAPMIGKMLDLFTSFLRFWYLVIFLIYLFFRPKSLGIESSFPCIWVLCPVAVFSMFTLDGIIRLYLTIMSLFSMIAFGSCFHEFWGTGVLKFLQMCRWITPHTLLCLCVYSCSDRWLILCVSTLQNLHLSDLLSPTIFLNQFV